MPCPIPASNQSRTRDTVAMHLDPEVCEKARKALDPRFDGRFFIGVKTTGIYCRPVCRVRPPLRKNIDFYPTAAAAEDAGFRPCKRCRPETAPGTPAWLGSSAVVSRGLRMIEAGVLDGDGSVEDMAGRLGVGPRHLRRLFVEHVGAAPLSLARTRRVHFARRLIDETELPMAGIASAAGFGSVRQFNDAVRRTFHQSPSELRRNAGGAAGPVVLRLPYRAPFDWEGLLAFMVPRAMPGVEQVVDGRYRRAFGSGGWIEVRSAENADALEVHVRGANGGDLIGIAARVRRLFDLSADPSQIAEDLSRDRRLRPCIRRRPGLRLPGAWDPFEIGVRAILGQQVSVKGATTLAGRLVQRFGSPSSVVGQESLSHLFPEASTLCDAELEPIGLPRARAEAIRVWARAVDGGSISFDGAAPLEETLDALRALPGFGDWTAQYVAMRAFAEPDAFPSGDLGLRKALSDGKDPAKERDVREASEAWRPWRSYAALWLWSSLGDEPPTPKKPTRPRKKT